MASFMDIIQWVSAPGAKGGATQTGKDFLLGKDREKVSILDDEQIEMAKKLWSKFGDGSDFDQMYNQAMQNQQQLLDPSSEAYDKFTDPYMRQFNEQTIPGLGERFAGKGANSGALSSSGFGQALGAAGAGLQENLASLKSQLMQKAAGGIMNNYNDLLKTGLGTQTFGYTEPTPGLLQEGLSSYAKAGFPGLGG